MRRSALLRLLLLIVVLVGANFGGFAYAYLARSTAGNPFFGNQANAGGLFPAYAAYVQQLTTANLTDVAVYGDDFGRVLLDATLASLGLLLASLAVSIVIGITIGLLGVRVRPPGVRGWLTAVTTVGLSTPSFFFGRLVVALFLLMIINVPGAAMPLPIQGFGWDVHLILPVIALSLRPTAQIGQIMAGLLAGELGRQYVTAARRQRPARSARRTPPRTAQCVGASLPGHGRNGAPDGRRTGRRRVALCLAWTGLSAGGDAHPGRVCLGIGGVALPGSAAGGVDSDHFRRRLCVHRSVGRPGCTHGRPAPAAGRVTATWQQR